MVLLSQGVLGVKISPMSRLNKTYSPSFCSMNIFFVNNILDSYTNFVIGIPYSSVTPYPVSVFTTKKGRFFWGKMER